MGYMFSDTRASTQAYVEVASIRKPNLGNLDMKFYKDKMGKFL